MSVALTPRVEALIKEKVASGLFRDADAVVSEALRVMEERDQFLRTKAAIAIGIAQIERGEVTTWTDDTLDELIREADEDDRLGLPIREDVLP